jgi:hypothetical protein
MRKVTMRNHDPIVVGKKDVDLTTPSHVSGVHEGNWPERRRSWREAIFGAPSRSTGINPKRRAPIDPKMPKLPPP